MEDYASQTDANRSGSLRQVQRFQADRADPDAIRHVTERASGAQRSDQLWSGLKGPVHDSVAVTKLPRRLRNGGCRQMTGPCSVGRDPTPIAAVLRRPTPAGGGPGRQRVPAASAHSDSRRGLLLRQCCRGFRGRRCFCWLQQMHGWTVPARPGKADHPAPGARRQPVQAGRPVPAAAATRRSSTPPGRRNPPY